MENQDSPHHGVNRGRLALVPKVTEEPFEDDIETGTCDQSQIDNDRYKEMEETGSCGIGTKRKYSHQGWQESQLWHCPDRTADKRNEFFKILMKLTAYPPCDVVQQLVQLGSDFITVLQEADISPHNFDLLVKVLAHASFTESNKSEMYDLFNKICEEKFINNLVSNAVTIKRKHPEKAQEYFANLIKFLRCYAGAMTTVAVGRITDSVHVFLGVLRHLESQSYASVDLIKQYESLQEMLDHASKHWEDLGQRKRNGKSSVEKSFPPEDFRTINVLPTPSDIFETDRPFLRKSIVKGKYLSGSHYLDVQFRLLREDFVRPLRNGINGYLKDSTNRVRDVRIYRGVKICGLEVNSSNVYHTVMIHPRSAINCENSKRLLFGNFLCFCSDNFKTLLFGSVAERDQVKLKRGFLGVKFESELSSQDMMNDFVMIESKAYFMPYKHVLFALQKISDNAIPMEPYIVHVQHNIDLPEYLSFRQDVKYDLSALNKNTMAPELSCSKSTHLKEVPIHKDLSKWPTSRDLGLDDSQLRAFKNALTRQFAIIQGPPGTGKTFLGLKIVQTLLNNQRAWSVKDEDDEAPILVVCYTNHALDQFLEGMKSFTDDIVRVGSRSKNDSLNRYQINSLAQCRYTGLSGKKRVKKEKLKDLLQYLRNNIKSFSELIYVFSSMDGVLCLDLLLKANVIQEQVKFQLFRNNIKRRLTDWLFSDVKPTVSSTVPADNILPVEKSSAYQMSTGICESKSSLLKEEIEVGSRNDDVEKLREMEERDRMLEEDLDILPRSKQNLNKAYELTDADLVDNMDFITASVDEPNAEYKLEVICYKREMLRVGLDFPEAYDEMEELENHPNLDIWKLDFQRRWQLYKYWVQKLKEETQKKLTALTDDYKKALKEIDVIKDQEYLYLMRKAFVVGMTTTGAAQHRNLLQDLAPPIVIIEEAAEILESHVLTSLSAKCQHLIMIGDHQQLRPSATVYELATKYGLETSLFERMIKNGLAYDVLEYQHRMRPAISKLLVPAMYPELRNHPSVCKFPNIKGITKNIFFISHQINEKEDTGVDSSHENLYEAEFLIGLCRHLILQGYFSRDITILTPYSGQFFLLRRLQREQEECTGVKVCVVDNYQGEENEIVLLSLVRSNDEGKVGFLQSENRICVALSRAKHGLYITGNMSQLSASSKLWKNIQKDLIDMECIGDSLTLQCQSHPDQEIIVTTGEDFFMKSPRGGCLQVCGKSLPFCQHSCPEPCHAFDHLCFKCEEPCSKVLCELEHRCPKLCYECWSPNECEPCTELVRKKLPCGHKHKVQCKILPEEYECPTSVIRELPHCHHMVGMHCHDNPEEVPCPSDCETRLDCGHKCRQKCHMKKDPEHNEYDCKEDCTRLNVGCSKSHPCQKKCHEECGACTYKVSKVLPCCHEADNVECSEPVENIKCMKKCRKTLPCGHPCKKTCYQECGDCPVKVKKKVPECGHISWVECCKPATPDSCDGQCSKMLVCGHPCTRRCQEPCTDQCNEVVESAAECPKGHSIDLPCHLTSKVEGEDIWQYCRELCNAVLNCGHTCVGDCGSCFQGRLHAACTSPCQNPLVCGHECQQPCVANCTPLKDPCQCQWRCSHSQCNKACGVLCKPCKEPCSRKCVHQKCSKLCGEKCSRPPCEQPCQNMLDKCGHPCIGMCGDPCPPLCRECDKDELFGKGEETSAEARFVLLEDCGHVIEAEAMKSMMEEVTSKIGFRKCPQCRQTIFNNRRYRSTIINTYEAVRKVKTKYNTSSKKYSITRKGIEVVLQDRMLQFYYSSRAQKPISALGIVEKGRPRIQKYLSDEELRVLMFQSQVLKKAASILQFYEENDRLLPFGAGYFQLPSRQPASQNEKLLKAKIDTVLDSVMGERNAIAPQMMKEVSCEMQRLMVLPSYWKFLEKCNTCSDENVSTIKEELRELFHPTVVFNDEREKKFSMLVKEAEKYLGSIEICNRERLEVWKAIGLKEGQWHKCVKGHIFFISECGGTVPSTQCPVCPDARVG